MAQLSEDDRRTMYADGLMLKEKVIELRRQISALDLQLAPIWQKERNLRERIQATHGLPPHFNPDTALDRKPLFEALLQISVEHGFTKTTRNDFNRQARGYTNELKAIISALDKDAKKNDVQR